MKRNVFFLLTMLVLFLMSCAKEDEAITYDCTGLTPTYTTDIKPLMDSRCATSGCHSSGSKAGGIDLSSYSAVSAMATNAKFMGSIEHASGYRSMPLTGSQLSSTQRQSIYCWIENGKPQ